MGFLKSLGKIHKSIWDPAGLFGGSGGDPGKAQLAETLRLQAAGMRDTDLGYAAAEGQARKALPVLQKGFAGAKEATSRGFDLGRKNLLEQTDKGLARDRQRMTNYGLQGSTFSNSRGIIGDSSRRIAELDAALSQTLSQLNVGEAQATAGALGNIGNVQAQRGVAKGNWQGNMAQTVQSVQYQKKKDIFDLIGAVAPLAFMGGWQPFAPGGGGNGTGYGGDDGGA